MTILQLDSSMNWQCFFQDAATPVMEGIINLHHDLMFFITFMFFFVLVLMISTLYFFNFDVNSLLDESSFVVHGTVMELMWTMMPSLILVVVALPSFALLYSIDEIIDPSMTIKVVGHQWYWSYEYSDFQNELGTVNFDSYMVAEDDLNLGDLSLLEVDNSMVIPVNSHTSMLVTAADVLHSWAVPSLGIKVDACIGRLNETSVFVLSHGVFYGQCSEICGVGHGNMPIVVETVNLTDYIAWLSDKV